MPTLAIQTPESKVSLESERLVITTRVDGEESESLVPLAEIERVLLCSRAHITSPALAALMTRGIPVSLMTVRGRFLGAFEPPGPSRGLVRLAQYQRQSDPIFAAAIVGKLVAAKISNQRRLVQRIDSNHGLIDESFGKRLAASSERALRSDSVDILRGVEGAAAVEFYAAWSRFLPDSFPFEKRSLRPPLNPVNACLSFIGSLLYGELLSACHARGLDPSLGHLHPTTDQRWSLPLDLVEPFRPCVINALTLRLFSHRILKQADFEPQKGGVYLNDGGRRTLMHHYEKTLEREHFSEFAQCRTSLRRQIQEAPLHYKMALADPARFNPFRMN
jgi:CRISPR-associated protein Cas1